MTCKRTKKVFACSNVSTQQPIPASSSSAFALPALSEPASWQFSSDQKHVKWLVRRDGSRPASGDQAGGLPQNAHVFASMAMAAGMPQIARDSVPTGHALELLPVGTHRGRGANMPILRYVWDGKRVTLVDESTLSQLSTAQGRLQQWFASVGDRLYRAFLPDAKDVTPDYWEWLKWRLTQRFFSSTIQNLSTQSLLLALGMGAKRTIAASAAINWLLKDGVGRIARMTVATNFGQAFDSDLKRIRFTTSIIFETTIGCEFITPFFPQHFLALASLANLGKAIALAAFVATAPAFQQALCAGGNLADLTAKNQAQHMMVDMLALGVSASAMYAAKNMKVPALLPLCAYPFLACMDLATIYRELKAVQLRTLNRERAEMVAAQWARTRTAPTAAQVSETERLLLPPSEGGELLPLNIVPLNQLLGSNPTRLPGLIKSYSDSQYMVDVQQPEEAVDNFRWPWQGPPRPKLMMSLSESADGSDVMTGILEAVYLRQAVQDHLQKKHMLPQQSQPQPHAIQGPGLIHSGEQDGEARHTGCQQQQPCRLRGLIQGLGFNAWNTGQSFNNYQNSSQGQQTNPMQGFLPWQQQATPVASLKIKDGLNEKEYSMLAKHAHKQARRDSRAFLKDVRAAGWKVDPFLLSTNEKEGYVVLNKH